jgi:hypothetical protein
VRFRPRKSTAADSLRPLLYGDLPFSQWPPPDGAQDGEPWSSFARAREAAEGGDLAAAQDTWRRIAATEGIEARHVLQAWHFLRTTGVTPPDDVAALVLGAVAEVPMGPAHDVLAAYADGSVRYLNHSGKVAVIEPPTDAELGRATSEWLAIAGQLSRAIGPWEGPLPPVPPGHARVLMLTPSGPRFGQGPYDALSGDAAAGAFLAAAANVLQIVVRMAGAGQA